MRDLPLPDSLEESFSASWTKEVIPASPMLMPPASMRQPMVSASSREPAITAPESPQLESLASATASSMVSKGITGISGPKVSSRMTSMSCETPVSTVGRHQSSAAVVSGSHHRMWTVAPFATASATWSRMTSACSAAIKGSHLAAS